jgi:hypothetical protein
VTRDLLRCPVEECPHQASAAPGQLAAHLIDDHGWSTVGARAGEAQIRRAGITPAGLEGGRVASRRARDL